MATEYYVNDISLVGFTVNNFNRKTATHDMHELAFDVKPVDEITCGFALRHEYAIHEGNRKSLSVRTETNFQIRDKENKTRKPSVINCLHVIRIGLEYTRALLAIEHKKQTGDFLLMGQPADSDIIAQIKQLLAQLN